MKFIFSVMLLLLTAHAFAQVDSRAEKLFRDQLIAVERNQYDQFIQNGTPEFKKFSRFDFAKVSAAMARRFVAGYQSSYFGDLNQGGYKVHFWKLTFTDKGDDSLVKMVVDRNSNIAGFWFQ